MANSIALNPDGTLSPSILKKVLGKVVVSNVVDPNKMYGLVTKNIIPSSANSVTTTFGNTGGATFVPGQFMTTGATTTSAGPVGDLDYPWGKREKKYLADVGFKWSPERRKFIMTLTVDVEIDEYDWIAIAKGAQTAVQEKIRELRNKIIERLKAKEVLASMLKPAKIEDHE